MNMLRQTGSITAAASAIVIAALLGSGTADATPETVLHSFAGLPDGNAPWAGLVKDSTGALYGTTEYGGKGGGSGAGTVFRLTGSGNSWTETTIYDFLGASDGDAPEAGLLLGKNGELFGTTTAGGTGSNGRGTVFSLLPPAKPGSHWRHKVLYSFCSQANCTDGDTPVAALVRDGSGALYGTTQFGGTSTFVSGGGGTVFKLTPPVIKGGAWTETVLYNFCSQQNCIDGYQPYGGNLLLTKAGIIYGTTANGGGVNAGTLFSLVPAQGGGYTETVLHDFGGNGGLDGRGPYGNLAGDKSGVLYGTTAAGGANGCGNVYSFGAAYSVLYDFCAKADHSDGALPWAGVIVVSGQGGTASALYGTTTNGNINSNGGVVFKLVPSGGTPWNETVLYSFCGQTNCTDGHGPAFGTLLDINGYFYGTTILGGTNDKGTVFQVRK